MSADEHLNPYQFDNAARLQAYQKAKSIPGSKAPVFFAVNSDRYVPNPLAAHIPPPVQEPLEDGAVRFHPQHGLPVYSPTARVERSQKVEQVPLDRLESLQGYVSRTHVNNMARRKGTPPPIDVSYHVNQDRYQVEEGNHRAVLAMQRGQSHIPAWVTRITQQERP